MKPTRSSSNLDDRCPKVIAAQLTGMSQPLLYMIISTALMMLLIAMFAVGFSSPSMQNNMGFGPNHVSHAAPQVAQHLVKI